ncbi:LLM class flavin-dependent oxidoreductase [Brachybacterium timonense]|uniref:LLM class flavin-dependent oxidoreductase n=1 Tax=Brachybacterium timonense TaxID=2050896 RepID=UPI000D0B54FE|nr:LLM class flavin-dependent oxidoreductase [Brachybacterium timonense]
MSDPVRTAPPRIGFLAQVEHTGVEQLSGGVTSRGLEEGAALFRRAEELGYDVGYIRVRHLQDAVSSPLLYLAALGQHVRRIQLGTAVIPLRFENPGRLAEDLATADLLLGGRLRAGLSSGYSAHDAMYVRAFGESNGDVRDHVDRVLADLLSFLDGTVVSHADAHIEGVAPGTPLTVQPQVPGLRSRLAYGAATVERAEKVGEQGLSLQLATLAPDDGSGRSFEVLQREVIDAYRAASESAGHGPGYVSVSRQMVPVAHEEDLEQFVSLIPRERTAAAGSTKEHRGQEIGGRDAVFSEVVIDSPGVVAQALVADAAVQAADEIVLTLPFGATAEQELEVLSVFGDQVLPHLVTALV